MDHASKSILWAFSVNRLHDREPHAQTAQRNIAQESAPYDACA